MAFEPAPAPPVKRGPKWYFSVLSREFSRLAGLNLIFVLSCLPVVTLGPALSAFGRVLGRMADDQPTEPVGEFWDAFRSRFLLKLGWGLALLAAAGVLGSALWFYGSLGGIFLPLAGLSLAGLLCLWGVALHLFPSLSDAVPPPHPLKAAALAALATFRRTALSILAALAFLLPQVLFFPVTVPLTCVIGLALPGLALAFPRLEG